MREDDATTTENDAAPTEKGDFKKQAGHHLIFILSLVHESPSVEGTAMRDPRAVPEEPHEEPPAESDEVKNPHDDFLAFVIRRMPEMSALITYYL